MTAIRKSYLIAPETTFGSGLPKNDKWYVVPQGFYMSTSSSTQATSLYGTGAKIRQNSIYGSFQGSWNASYVMDFEHLEFLSIIFDTEDDAAKPNGTQNTTNKQYANFNTADTNVYEHRFRKLNNKRQQSYVIKERILNKIAGGHYDEETIYKGVLARNLQLARSTSGSQMAVEMSGVFADKITSLNDTGNIGSLFTQNASPLTQYSCMYLGIHADPVDTDAIKQVDSHSINIETSVSLVYSTCSPIATDYFEDRTTFAWNATAYMNDPTRKFKLLPNSGGTVNPKVGTSLKVTDNGRSFSRQPMGKNLAPLEFVNFITYDESVRDQYSQDYQESIVNAYNASSHVVRIQAINSTVKSTTTPKGDGSKLQDSLSSVECDEIIISIKNSKQYIWDSSDEYNGPTDDFVGQMAKFTQAAITDVTSEAIDFKIPVTGYSGAILGSIDIAQSNTVPTSTISFNSSTHGDLRGFVVVQDVSMFNVSGATGDAAADTYMLDNLIPKQLTNAGSGMSGLTVQTAKSGDDIFPQITGTPEIIRTDYYFIVKKDTSGSTPVITTGYLRVAVR